MKDRPLDSATVGFQLEALERVTDPSAVFRQTAGWADHVGVLSDRPTHVITEFARAHHLDLGFHSGPRTLRESLPQIRVQPELDADRYVVIATDELDTEGIAESGWEVLPLAAAAAAGGWTVRDADDEEEESSWV